LIAGDWEGRVLIGIIAIRFMDKKLAWDGSHGSQYSGITNASTGYLLRHHLAASLHIFLFFRTRVHFRHALLIPFQSGRCKREIRNWETRE
jgi:hypothetical protein